MFGILLTILGTLSEEISTSLGKSAVARHVESIFALGFINALCGLVFFVSLICIRSTAVMISSWPTLLARIACELVLALLTVIAVSQCTRSTFGFIRVGTIPLLLLVDVVMGYTLHPSQVVGIAIITFSLFLLYTNHGFEKRGAIYAVIGTVLSVATTSLAKYDFSHGNSLEAEQALIYLVLASFFCVFSVRCRENPVRLLLKPVVMLQAAAIAVGSVLLTYGFNLMTPSIHMAAKRSTAAMASIGSGYLAFHEKHIKVKIISSVLCVLGILLLFL